MSDIAESNNVKTKKFSSILPSVLARGLKNASTSNKIALGVMGVSVIGSFFNFYAALPITAAALAKLVATSGEFKFKWLGQLVAVGFSLTGMTAVCGDLLKSDYPPPEPDKYKNAGIERAKEEITQCVAKGDCLLKGPFTDPHYSITIKEKGITCENTLRGGSLQTTCLDHFSITGDYDTQELKTTIFTAHIGTNVEYQLSRVPYKTVELSAPIPTEKLTGRFMPQGMTLNPNPQLKND